MADITRKLPGVQPNNYIRPGVQSPSPLSLGAALGSQAIDLDKALAKERLSKETDALNTQYETSNPLAIAEQEAALTPEDQKQVQAVDKQLAAFQSAVDQGAMSYDQYRIRGERMLRLAISKRPGMAQELRAVAAQHLGVDVVGATVEVASSWENKMLSALASSKEVKDTRDPEQGRKDLAAAGLVVSHLTDEQMWVEHEKHMMAIVENTKQKAVEGIATSGASTLEAKQKLRRPEATAAFVNEVQKNNREVYTSIANGAMAFATGKLTPEQMSQVIAQGNADIIGRINNLRLAQAQGDVDPAMADKAIAGLEELGRQMNELATGKLSKELMQNKMDGAMLWMMNNMLDSENALQLAAANKLFPDVMQGFVGPNGAYNKVANLALADMLNGTGDPTDNARNAGDIASNLVITLLDKGGAQSSPESIPAMAKTFIRSGVSFVEMPAKDFKSAYLTGPKGWLTVLNTAAPGIAKAMSEGDKQEVMGAVAVASMANYYHLARDMDRRFPSLGKKVIFDLDPKTGDFVHLKPGQGTAADKAAIAEYNRAFSGKYVLNILGTLGNTDAVSARNMMYEGTSDYKEMRAQALKKPAAPQQAKPIAAPESMGGPSSGKWWGGL